MIKIKFREKIRWNKDALKGKVFEVAADKHTIIRTIFRYEGTFIDQEGEERVCYRFYDDRNKMWDAYASDDILREDLERIERGEYIPYESEIKD